MIILIVVLLLVIAAIAACATQTFVAALIDGAHAGPGSWSVRHTTGRHRLVAVL